MGCWWGLKGLTKEVFIEEDFKYKVGVTLSLGEE